MSKLNKRALWRLLLLLIGLPIMGVLVGVGALVWPGWGLGWAAGLVAGRMEGQYPGVELQVEGVGVRYRAGGIEVTVSGVAVGTRGGDRLMALRRGWGRLSLGRVFGGRLLPERVEVEGLDIWARVEAPGLLVLPEWLPESEDKAPTDWTQFRLGQLPGLLRLAEGERVEVQVSDYRAHLLSGAADHPFEIPHLAIELEGWARGAQVRWQTTGWEYAGERFLEGTMMVDVLGERVEWRNGLGLPLTPALAEWLQAGFGYLPIPPVLDTGVRLESGGELDLASGVMQAGGSLEIAAGAMVVPRSAVEIQIPAVAMGFMSNVELRGMDVPKVVSQIRIQIGDGGRLGTVHINAAADPEADTVLLDTDGRIEGLDAIAELLPEALRVVEVGGDLRWQMALETGLRDPLRIKSAMAAAGSGGIRLAGAAAGIDGALEITPFEISGRMERGGTRVTIAPFSVGIGPLRIAGTGLDWQRGDGEAQWVGSTVGLSEPLAMGALLEYVPDAYLAGLADYRALIEALEVIGEAEVEVGLRGAAAGTVEIVGAKMRPRWQIQLHGQALDGGLAAEWNPQSQRITWDGTLARFNPFAMQLPYTAAYANLDSVIRLATQGEYALSTAAAQAELSMALQPGALHLGEALEAYMVPELAFGGLEGKLTLGLQGMRLERMEATGWIASGGLRVEGQSRLLAALELPKPEALALEIAGKVTLGETAQMLAQLDAAYRESLLGGLPVAQGALEDLGVETLEGSVQLGLAGLTGGAPTIERLAMTGRAAARIGEVPVKIGLELARAASTQQLELAVDIAPFDIGRSGWQPGPILPIALSDITVPLGVKLTGALPWDGGLAGFADTLAAATVGIAVESAAGRVEANRYLGRALSYSGLKLQIEAAPLAQTLTHLSLEVADFMGGGIVVGARDLALAESGPTGHLAIGVETLPLDWCLAALPVALLPESLATQLQGVTLGGQLDSFALDVELGAAQHPQLPYVRAAALKLGLKALQLARAPLPPLSVAAVDIAADLAQLQLKVEGVALAGQSLPSVALAVMEPLGKSPSAQADGQWIADIDALNAVLGSLPQTAPIAQQLAAYGIGGGLRGEWTLEALLTNGRMLDANLRARTDMRDLATAIPGLAGNKIAGEASELTIALEANALVSGAPGPAAVEMHFDLNGLLFDALSGSLQARNSGDYAAAFAGLQSLAMEIAGPGETRVQTQVGIDPAGAVAVDINAPLIDVGPLVTQVEPWLVALLSGSEASDAPTASVPPEATTTAEAAPPAPSALPDITLSLNIDALRMGALRRTGALTLDMQLREGLPEKADFRFDNGAGQIEFGLRTLGSTLSYGYRMSDLRSWLDTAVTPLQLMQSAPARANASVALIESLPGYIRGGDLQFGGTLSLGAQPQINLSELSIEGLTLQAEVPFLSKIAGLVNRQVVLKVPFQQFTVARMTATPLQIGISEVFLDGPLNVSFESIDYGIASKATDIKGKVFGIAFEVVGTAPDLKFYLQEKGMLLDAVTEEDDFEW